MVGNKRKSFDVVTVRTIELKNTILAVCQERNDAWANNVQARILSAHDLHAADAIYHKICDVNFRTMKQIPTAYTNEKLCSTGLYTEILPRGGGEGRIWGMEKRGGGAEADNSIV